jgi:tetratricopeptide (TPR) repeat protein
LGRWEDSLDALKRCDSLYPNDLWTHVHLFIDYTALDDTDAARAEAAEVRRIVALDPKSALGYRALAIALNTEGKPAEALLAAEKAMKLEARDRTHYGWLLGMIYTQLGRWDDGISALEGYVDLYPEQLWPHVNLAVAYIEVGREDAARAEVAQVLRIQPQFSLKMGIEGMLPMQKERVRADLVKAGLT